MSRLFLKLPFFWSFRRWSWPPVLPLNYTFSLTWRCNSRCQTCGIWQKKPIKELTGREWRRVFRRLGHSPYWVTLSGGEPFLRKDLVAIVKDLCRICQPKIMTIPTNGILANKIQKDVREILKACPKTRLIVNLSLDGIGKRHDQIRGVKGNFEKATKTYQKLKKIEAKNFVLGVHTVISKENVSHFPELSDFVLDQLRPDSYVTEIAEQRVELGTLNKKITPSLKDYREAVEYLRESLRVPAKRADRQKFKGLNKLIWAFRSTYYQMVEEILEKKTQVIPCYAGVASAQITPNGDVWPCCVRADVLGNLKKENFDFSKIWFSERASKIRKSIKEKKCYCPLANAGYTNILMSPISMVKVIFNFFR